MSYTSPRGQSSLIPHLFSEYYSRAILKLPDDIEFREFAFQPFGVETYVRHLSFRSPEGLRRALVQRPVLHVYYSSALYLHPSAPSMDEKGWTGSDLLFDIDADQIPGCSVQKLYRCRGSGEILDSLPEQCAPEVDEIDIVTSSCISLALDNLAALLDVLVEELGISRSSIEASFSGNRGFHVHVFADEELRMLGREERKDLAEYVSGEGFSHEILRGLGRAGGETAMPPTASEGGIASRIARKYLQHEKPQDPRTTSYLLQASGRLSREALEALENLWDKNLYRIYIDEKVTIDTSRLVRIPESLNGKTGLRAALLDINKVDNFQPGPWLSPFEDLKALIRVSSRIPKINFYGIDFQASPGTSYIVQAPLGIFLGLKGLAEILSIQ